MRRIMAWNDERWNIQAYEILRLGTGRGVVGGPEPITS
jgi:hypothetical protein